MKERPILMSGPLVLATMKGLKTQTRRVMNPQPQWLPEWGSAVGMNGAWMYGPDPARTEDLWGAVMDADTLARMVTVEAYGWGVGAGCPCGISSDRLWVRETFAGDSLNGYVYRADHPAADLARGDLDEGEQCIRRWIPSIHMTRRASRLTLEITEVRAQRIQNISEEDAKAEGVESDIDMLAKLSHIRGAEAARHVPSKIRSARDHFAELWDSINGQRLVGGKPITWAANPWVWCISYRLVT